MKRKNSTVSSYNFISYYFHAKAKGKQLWNKTKFKLIGQGKNKFANDHGGMIIKLRAAIFERIRNVQIQALQVVFSSLLSLAFSCVFHLWFKRYQQQVVYDDVTHDSVTCSLTLRHVVTSYYWKSLCKMPSALEYFLFSEIWTNKNNRIAGKLMNIKKILLFVNFWGIFQETNKNFNPKFTAKTRSPNKKNLN